MSKIDVAGFFTAVQSVHATGQATEHSYRKALQNLLESINPALTVINEPRRIECGSPDFVIMRDDVPVGYVEAKDVGLDIRKMKGANKGQQDRYKDGLPNLIYTNGLDFDFYRHDGEGKSIRIADVCIGDYLMGLQPNKTQFDVLENLLYEFVSQDTQAQTITSSNRLAKIMAGKAKLIRDALGKALVKDEKDESELAAQYLGFKDTLIHDITKEGFADVYAETIVYGMFAARYHDPTPENFSRQEALELLPKSNPFLRKLFTFIAAHDLDDGIRWIIDDLAMIFQATRVDNIMGRWSDANDKRDPFLHFYETFLAEYNPSKRKSRGVWYTPEAVVNFIVRAVDDVLKTEFNEPMGLASTTKIPVKIKTGTKEVGRKGSKRREDVYETQDLHRVQILDPATGTGTFLAEVIHQIEPRIKAVDEGGWSDYVENDLKPRLHGFELLMASYSMCHLKLDMMLTETGYVPPKDPKRLSVWLTNSLEEPQEDDNSLPLFGLARAISDEAKGANDVKADKPIMCIIGNPPYSGVSQNMSTYAKSLIEHYKYVDGVHFRERKHWLHDDYVKFIAMSEKMINENGEGILAFITNHGYLDNPTFRGMRWQLLQSFDKISVLDLHGSTKKQVAPSGQQDQNVFDIQQGVAIVLARKFKTSEANKAIIHHSELWGTRNEKSKSLGDLSISSVSTAIKPDRPFFLYKPQDFKTADKYYDWPKLNELFSDGSMGVQTSRDHFAIHFTKKELEEKLLTFKDLRISDAEIRSKLFPNKKEGKYLAGDTRGWKITEKRKELSEQFNEGLIRQINYRPFDKRWTYFSDAIIDWPRLPTMKNFLEGENLAILFPRQLAGDDFYHALMTDTVAEMCVISNKTKEQNAVFPLYLYPEEQTDGFKSNQRTVNMDPDIRAAIEDAAEHAERGRPDEVEIFDYIYGVLHCPAYRETYAEFLKIDFPRVPYPSSPERFWDISAKGAELRKLHLMDGIDAGTAYPFKGEAPEEEGSGYVDKIGKKSFALTDTETGNVLINDTQYFEGVPKTAWEFYIGGYQPAQKWLKDRKGRTLSFDDRMHYRKIIHILMETDSIMKTIEMDL